MKETMIKRGGGGHNSCQFGCFASKFGRILNALNKSKANAFTLAEVLITLVIIGVVAALTIPTIVINYQKKQTVTQLKKVYSALSQTTNKAIADHGPIKNWEIELSKTKEFVDKYMAPYLRLAKVCGYDNSGDCLFKVAPLNNKTNFTSYASPNYTIILEDGTYICIRTYVEDARSAKYPDVIHRSYARVLIDLNGQKDPNVMGKDQFYYIYWIDADIRPWGYPDYTGTFKPNGEGESLEHIKSSCSNQGNGVDCAALIMLDGWQMKDYYPW